MQRSLLLSLSSTLASSGGSLLDDGGGLVLLGNGQSLAVLGKLVEHVSALAAGVSVGVIGHVGSRGALFALNLELSNLAGVIDVEVLKDGLGSLLVLVLYLLGLGVDLLLSLLLTTVKGKADVDC